MLLEDKYKQLPLIPHLLKALLPAAGIIYKRLLYYGWNSKYTRSIKTGRIYC